jgi:hypothetical protein
VLERHHALREVHEREPESRIHRWHLGPQSLAAAPERLDRIIELGLGEFEDDRRVEPSPVVLREPMSSVGVRCGEDAAVVVADDANEAGELRIGGHVRSAFPDPVRTPAA